MIKKDNNLSDVTVKTKNEKSDFPNENSSDKIFDNKRELKTDQEKFILDLFNGKYIE